MSDEVKTDVLAIPFRKKYLTTHRRARKFLNTLVNDMREAHGRGDQVNTSYYRTMAYMIRTMLDFWAYESDQRIIERLEIIETKINERQGADEG